jgi:hypothetical protein
MSQNKLIASNFEYHKEGLTRTREHKKKKVPLLILFFLNKEKESNQL